MEDAIAAAMRATLDDDHQPTAPPPPKLDCYEWAAVCRPDPEAMNRCGRDSCAVCQWEREADIMHAASPWREGALIEDREADNDREFRSLNAAICAFAEHKERGPSGGSMMGVMLERVRLGMVEGRTLRHDNDPRSVRRVMRRVDLVRAFEGICRGELAAPISRELAIGIVLARCPGVRHGTPIPTYVELCEQLLALDYSATPRQLKRVNRLARRELIVELVARQLMRQPLDLDANMLEAIENRVTALGARKSAA